MNILAQMIDFQTPDNINTVTPTTVTVRTAMQLFFGVLAAVAVLIIVLGALRFVLSRGNPEGQNRARNTIVFAGIGLAVAVMALSIISFVIGVAG